MAEIKESRLCAFFPFSPYLRRDRAKLQKKKKLEPMFAHFGFHRRPTLTYKRKQSYGSYRSTVSDDADSPPTTFTNSIARNETVDPLDSLPTTPDSTSESRGEQSGGEDQEEQDESSPSLDIFDLPPEEASEVSLMVASSRKVPYTSAQSTSARRKKHRKAPKRMQKKLDPIPSQTQRITDNVKVQAFKKPAVPIQQDQGALPTTPSISYPQLYTHRKRKLNLVSRLKGAQGQESQPTFRGYSSMDEEEEDIEEDQELLNSKFVQRLTNRHPDLEEVEPPQPECSYEERMERELESLIRTEFGHENEEEQEKTTTKEPQRPRYVPENPMNVRVTYKRSAGKANGAGSDEMSKIQHLLSELRELDPTL